MLNFQRSVHEESTGIRLFGRWKNWLRTCRCGDIPNLECEVHLVQRLCREYTEIIDMEWYKIAQWYVSPPQHPHPGGRDDVGDLYRQFPYKLEDLDDK
jgi:hypothetical protein